MYSLLYSLHGEGDTLTAMVYLNDSYLDVLMEFHYVEWMGDTTISHLGNMHQSVLMDTDIYESSEVGDVRDDARQYHSLFEVVDGGDILVELEFL